MEEIEYDNFDDLESHVLSGSDGFLQESFSVEEIDKEREENSGIENQFGLYDDSLRDAIDYSKLETSVRNAQIINTIDSDLDDLEFSDVALLIIIFLLGIILIGGKGR